MNCPHCKKIAFHQEVQQSSWYTVSSAGDYSFQCQCIKYVTLNKTFYGWTYLVKRDGSGVTTDMIVGNYRIVTTNTSFTEASVHGKGTHIFSFTDHQVQNSSIKYKKLAYILSLPEIKDLNATPIKDLLSWATTLAVFS